VAEKSALSMATALGQRPLTVGRRRANAQNDGCRLIAVTVELPTHVERTACSLAQTLDRPAIGSTVVPGATWTTEVTETPFTTTTIAWVTGALAMTRSNEAATTSGP
jgi:hypothetical protein